MKGKIIANNGFGSGMLIKRKCCKCKEHKVFRGGKVGSIHTKSGKRQVFTCEDCLVDIEK